VNVQTSLLGGEEEIRRTCFAQKVQQWRLLLSEYAVMFWS